MSGFLYFRSGDQRAVTKERIDQWGLSYAFTGSPEGRPTNHSSFTKSQGYVFCDPKRHTKAAGLYEGEQTWRKMPAVEGRPELWVGYYNDAKPTPSDLKREKLLRGPVLRLADGNDWQVPIVRRYDDAAQEWHCELPTYLDLDAEGNVAAGRPLTQYAHLWDATATIAELQFAKDSGDEVRDLTHSELIAAVAALMGANYVVSLPELVALEALEESHLAMIVMVAVRYQAVVNWLTTIQKKSDQSTLSGATTPVGEMV